MKYIIILLLFASQGFGQNIAFKRVVPQKVKKDSVITPSKIVFDDLLNSSNEPLFIIDGNPIDPKQFKNIDVNTIESVTILKDSLSKNVFDGVARKGVIIIKTKKPPKKVIQENEKEK